MSKIKELLVSCGTPSPAVSPAPASMVTDTAVTTVLPTPATATNESAGLVSATAPDASSHGSSVAVADTLQDTVAADASREEPACGISGSITSSEGINAALNPDEPSLSTSSRTAMDTSPPTPVPPPAPSTPNPDAAWLRTHAADGDYTEALKVYDELDHLAVSALVTCAKNHVHMHEFCALECELAASTVEPSTFGAEDPVDSLKSWHQFLLDHGKTEALKDWRDYVLYCGLHHDPHPGMTTAAAAWLTQSWTKCDACGAAHKVGADCTQCPANAAETHPPVGPGDDSGIAEHTSKFEMPKLICGASAGATSPPLEDDRPRGATETHESRHQPAVYSEMDELQFENCVALAKLHELQPAYTRSVEDEAMGDRFIFGDHSGDPLADLQDFHSWLCTLPSKHYLDGWEDKVDEIFATAKLGSLGSVRDSVPGGDGSQNGTNPNSNDESQMLDDSLCDLFGLSSVPVSAAVNCDSPSGPPTNVAERIFAGYSIGVMYSPCWGYTSLVRLTWLQYLRVGQLVAVCHAYLSTCVTCTCRLVHYQQYFKDQ